MSNKLKNKTTKETVLMFVYGGWALTLVKEPLFRGLAAGFMCMVDLDHVSYRPLVGNGVNRDTSVYVGVQTLENSGVDRRVDLIVTEAGMEWKMPESHAIWT